MSWSLSGIHSENNNQLECYLEIHTHKYIYILHSHTHTHTWAIWSTSGVSPLYLFFRKELFTFRSSIFQKIPSQRQISRASQMRNIELGLAPFYILIDFNV